nr:hypothetical protein [Sphingopyxis sp.]
MPETRQSAGASQCAKNWNDRAAKRKPGICHGSYDETFTADTGSRCRTLGQQRADLFEAARQVGSKVNDGGKGTGTRQERRIVAAEVGAIDMGGFGMHQPAVAADTPIVAEQGVASILAHGVATQ